MQTPNLSVASVPGRTALQPLKWIGCILCLTILASNFWSMSRWSERRGVVDDLCYLRQAHLFQKSGIHGIDTDILPETDNYFAKLTQEVGHPEWHSASGSWCHVQMPATGKRVIQYPPGTGFLLAAFPEGFQVIPLYAASTVLVLVVALIAIGLAATPALIVAATTFGAIALYWMINPAKASYSLAPTMAICALAGCLTAALFNARTNPARLGMALLIGLMLGASVNFRVANLVLGAGYFIAFLIAFVRSRHADAFLQGVAFGLAYFAGLVPTLIANAVNAGSPFSTTYGPDDTQARYFSLAMTKQYLFDMQGVVVLLAAAGTLALLVLRSARSSRETAIVIMVNLIANSVFFLSHPIYQSYYLMPVAVLSLWTLLFCILMQARNPDVGS